MLWCGVHQMFLSYYVKDNPNATLASLSLNPPPHPPPPASWAPASPIRTSLQDAKTKKETNKQINRKTQYERQKNTNNPLQGDLAVQHFLSIFIGHCGEDWRSESPLFCRVDLIDLSRGKGSLKT